MSFLLLMILDKFMLETSGGKFRCPWSKSTLAGLVRWQDFLFFLHIYCFKGKNSCRKLHSSLDLFERPWTTEKQCWLPSGATLEGTLTTLAAASRLGGGMKHLTVLGEKELPQVVMNMYPWVVAVVVVVKFQSKYPDSNFQPE